MGVEIMAWGTLSRQARGYGADWEQARKVAIERDGKLCQPCKKIGRVTIFYAVDHIKPKAQCKALGWSKARMDHPSNLQCICQPCHNQKSKEEVGATYKKPVKYGADGWPIEG